MRYYVGLGYGHSPRELIALAQHAEAAGFDGITFGDHLAVAPVPSTPYPSGNGRPSFASETAWPDVWVLAAAMAAVTTRIHFLSTVYLLPLRHPLAVAKSVATAALVADDRIELGVGVGWQRDEFDAVGVDFRTRGRRTDEAIGVLRQLWSPGPTEHHGRFFDFGPLIAEPTLLRPPPIHVGGSSPAAIRRAARLGDGYITMPATSVELAELLPQVREAATREGRDPAALEVLANCSDARTADDYGRVADLGADVVLVRPVNLGGAPDLSGVRTGLDQFAARVLEPLARSTEAD